jgi:hypothetical protein
MSATLKLNSGIEAVIDDDMVWTCLDPDWQAMLTEATAFVQDSGADPNPPLTRAAAMAALFGGEVTAFDQTETDELVGMPWETEDNA